jgi:hypothetical protein
LECGRPSDLLLWTTAVAAAFGLATRFFGGVSRPLGFIPLSTVDMGIAVGIVIAYRAS